MVYLICQATFESGPQTGMTKVTTEGKSRSLIQQAQEVQQAQFILAFGAVAVVVCAPGSCMRHGR